MPVARFDTSRSAYTAGLFHVHTVGAGMFAVVHASGAEFMHGGAPFHAARAFADILALHLGARGADATGYGWTFEYDNACAIDDAYAALFRAFPEANLVGAARWTGPEAAR
jgi:hypothetical protein